MLFKLKRTFDCYLVLLESRSNFIPRFCIKIIVFN